MANDTKEIVDSLHEAAKNAVNTVYSDCTEVIERLREHESDTNWDAQLGEEINTLKRETGDLWENKKQFGLDQIDKLSGDVADTATELYQVMLGLLQRFIVTAVKWLQQAQDNATIRALKLFPIQQVLWRWWNWKQISAPFIWHM
ncbi:hypothetical protein AO1008_02888 [Aspergillus oryzae 100-8]|uniref:Uncharacterized protein n=1 Tax=Aspergillus oryzae (strain 3.042) TaxID=1160506 RepID=I8A8I9_ASPO3|nr:hypothetical protein Ao3042_02284 [Aspergillus oryzae 3.042]KDE85858.1 hypothetical protein AO1008_02888 [Aspergillus oryzae 100-8]|eukprot:EIT81164.1 hypothetical protein Ao3042_02284 [Aspergillus oryzae 3.042]